MSWNPFSSKRAAPKKSAISKSAEREFEREQKKVETLDENTRKLYKDMKRCCEASAAMSKSEMKMSQDLCNSALTQNEEQLKALVESWNKATQQLELHVTEMNTTSQKAVVDPMKKLSGIFPSVQAAIKKRNESLLEYNKVAAKVDKYQDRERTGPNIVKLETNKKVWNSAKQDFENQNSALMEDMPKLVEKRIDYFEPSFQALIKSQLKYYTEAHKIYTELSSTVTAEKKLSDQEYENKLQQKLAEIKALSIVVDD